MVWCMSPLYVNTELTGQFNHPLQQNKQGWVLLPSSKKERVYGYTQAWREQRLLWHNSWYFVHILWINLKNGFWKLKIHGAAWHIITCPSSWQQAVQSTHLKYKKKKINEIQKIKSSSLLVYFTCERLCIITRPSQEEEIHCIRISQQPVSTWSLGRREQ